MNTRRQRDWQKTDPHLRKHPAFLRFRNSLKISDNEAHGILAGLWAFAFDFAQDGDLSRFAEEDVALVIGYLGDVEQLFMSLRQYFLDGSRIRSWEEWGGALFADRAWEAQRKWEQRNKRKSTEQEEMSQGQGGTTWDCPTREEKRREEKKDLNPLALATTRVAPDDSGFVEFWAVFPNKQGKRDALRHWRRFTPDQRLRALNAAQAVAFAVANGYQEARYVPHGSSWLNQERFDDWYDDQGHMTVPPNYAVRGNGKLQARLSQIDRLVAEMEET